MIESTPHVFKMPNLLTNTSILIISNIYYNIFIIYCLDEQNKNKIKIIYVQNKKKQSNETFLKKK